MCIITPVKTASAAAAAPIVTTSTANNKPSSPFLLNAGTFPHRNNNSDGGMRQLSLDFVPGPYDVLCSRGNAVKNHSGNAPFLQIVNDFLPKYGRAGVTKVEKSIIVTEIIDTIRESSPMGGFIKFYEGCWYEVGDNQAREKTSQALRDRLSSKYNSSSVTKKRRRLAKEATLAHEVDTIVAQSNGIGLAARIQALIAETTSINNNTNSKNKKKSDEEFQKIFNQANTELLNRIRQANNKSAIGA